MINEIAIIPDVFDRELFHSTPEVLHEITEVLMEASRSAQPANILIANLDKGYWQRYVQETVNKGGSGCAPARLMNQRRITMSLEALAKLGRLVRHRRRSLGHPASSREWLELALDSHQRIPFDWIVVTPLVAVEETIEGRSIVPVTEIRESKTWAERPTSRVVVMSRKGYSSVVGPLLRHARIAKIVDPFVSCSDARHSAIVEIVASGLGQRATEALAGIIEIHVAAPSADIDITACKALWAQHLQGIVRRRGCLHEFNVYFWKERGNHREAQWLHNRYLLTNQFGVAVGIGFDCFAEPAASKDEWHIMSEDLRSEIWYRFHVDNFGQSDGPFELKGFLCVRP